MANTKETVKDYQRHLAQLAGAHTKAQERLDDQLAKRMQAIADMARDRGADLTSAVTGVEIAELRRLIKGSRPTTPGE